MMTVDAPVTILDLSLGGFGVETARALDDGDIHECRFTLRDGVSVILPAKVVHCRPKKGPKGSTRYLAGLEFLPQPTPDAEAARVQLIDRIASTLPKAARKNWVSSTVENSCNLDGRVAGVFHIRALTP